MEDGKRKMANGVSLRFSIFHFPFGIFRLLAGLMAFRLGEERGQNSRNRPHNGLEQALRRRAPPFRVFDLQQPALGKAIEFQVLRIAQEKAAADGAEETVEMRVA